MLIGILLHLFPENRKSKTSVVCTMQLERRPASLLIRKWTSKFTLPLPKPACFHRLQRAQTESLIEMCFSQFPLPSYSVSTVMWSVAAIYSMEKLLKPLPLPPLHYRVLNKCHGFKRKNCFILSTLPLHFLLLPFKMFKDSLTCTKYLRMKSQ